MEAMFKTHKLPMDLGFVKREESSDGVRSVKELDSQVSALLSQHSGAHGRFDKVIRHPRYIITEDEITKIASCK